MVALFTTASVATIAFAVLPAVQAHMSIWTPSMYGFDSDWDVVTPLANQPFDQWKTIYLRLSQGLYQISSACLDISYCALCNGQGAETQWFHNKLWGSKPSEVMTIPAGGSLSTEIACGKAYTSWGNQQSGDACPHDSGAYHAGGQTGSQSGWGGNSEENLAGCALAIAYKADASQVRPEDFTIMSVQENCVRQRDTNFEIPANLPACPDGECTCAWFWQGKNSAMEMYMTGFRCNVQGGVVTNSFPSPVPPKRGSTITGPTQPMYWANDNSNLDYWPEWSNKPSYNRAFGWQNGAQTSAFEGLGGNGNAPVPSASSSNLSDSAVPSATGGWDGEQSSSRTRTRTRTTDQYTRSDTHWYNHVASPTVTGNPAPTSTSGHGGRCKRNLRSRRRVQLKAHSS